MKDLVASNSHLVLLSSSENADVSTTKWTLYNLALPTALALYKNMIELANMSRTLNPLGYLELISEAHIALRAACHQLTWQIATTKDTTAEIEALLKETKESYQASCQLLGNYYALHAERKNEAHLALPYYRYVCTVCKNEFCRLCRYYNLQNSFFAHCRTLILRNYKAPLF